MLITEYSIWMTVLWSSVLILLFYILRKKSILLDICSVSGVIVLYAFCMIRMIVPAEFSWTKVISGGEPYRVLYKALHQRVFSFVYVNDILGMIWIVGAAILVLKYIGEYIRLQKYISSIPSVEDERINEILSKVVSTQVPRVVKTGAVSIPCCFGIFKQTVILPDIKYSDEELYYILLHECSHLRNKDILTKALTNILCALYWWNPLVYLLKKDLNQSLEISANLSEEQAGVVNKSFETYLSSLIQAEKDRHVSESYKIDNRDGIGNTGELNKYYSLRKPIGMGDAESLKSQITSKIPQKTRDTLLENIKNATENGSVVQSASNEEVAGSIMNLFKNANLHDSKAVSELFQQYKDIITPVYRAFGLQDTSKNASLSRVIDEDIKFFDVQISNAKAIINNVGNTFNSTI